MKNTLLSLCLCLVVNAFSQHTAKDFFSKNDMIWYGLNFSKAKMIGQFDQAVGAGVATGLDLKNRWYSSWNTLILSEPKNYKLGEAFRKTNVYNDIKPVEKQNSKVEDDQILSYNSYAFSEPDKIIKDIVSNLSTGDKKEGIGVMFVVESFNKMTDEATIYVTIFDIKTKSVIITDKMIGKPNGFGLRNFWGGAIKSILKQINFSYYNKWRNNTD